MIFNFHATFRSANSNPSCTSTMWMPYNVSTTQRTHDPGKQSVRHVTFHVTCLSVSVVVLLSHVSFTGCLPFIKKIPEILVGNFRSVRTVRVVYHLPKISGVSCNGTKLKIIVNGKRISIRNVPIAKTGLPFQNFRLSRNFPVRRTKKSFSI